MVILRLWSVDHIDVLFSDDSLTVFTWECIVVNEWRIERKVHRFVTIIAAAFNQSNHSIALHITIKNLFLLFNCL